MARLTEQPSKGQALKRDQVALDLEAALRNPQSRRVLMLILERCGVYRNAYSGSASPTDFRLGEQNIGLWLISMISSLGPDEYPSLLRDAAQAKQDEERNERADNDHADD